MTLNERVEAYWQEFAAARGVADQAYTAFAFGYGAEMADSLLSLVIGGDKRATAGLARDYASGDEPMPQPGDYSVVLDGAGEPACIIRTTQVVCKPLCQADEAFAWDEGEGDRSLAEWMEIHVRFFELQAATEGFEFSPDLETVFQRFEVVWPECPATVRPETPGDGPAIHALTAAAFASSSLGHHGEAELVDQIRAHHPGEILSLVAEVGGQVVGHILFSPATLGDLRGMGLAPMSVAPGWQGERIGRELIRAGLATLRERGFAFVIVLGHPSYYARFGFRPATAFGVGCPFEGGRDEAFALLRLDCGAPLPKQTAHYVPELES